MELQKVSLVHDSAIESDAGTAATPAIGATSSRWVAVVSSIDPSISLVTSKGPVAAVTSTPSTGTATVRSWLKLPSATVNVGQDRIMVPLSKVRASDSVPYMVVRSCEPSLAVMVEPRAASNETSPSESQSRNRLSSSPLAGTRQAVSRTPRPPTTPLVQWAPLTVNSCEPALGTEVTSVLVSDFKKTANAGGAMLDGSLSPEALVATTR